MDSKASLRREFRARRREGVAALPASTRALLFLRPPGAVAHLVPEGSTVGLYFPNTVEAPTKGYASWFHERGHPLALPAFADRGSPMAFRRWHDPLSDNELEAGAYGITQPEQSAETVTPDIVFVPLLAFTDSGHRLGQGGGHYDRWLAANPGAVAIGMAWDFQLAKNLPLEPHDRPLTAVVTPTRLYGPFSHA